jgi:hypothetical protein
VQTAGFIASFTFIHMLITAVMVTKP